MKTRVRLPEPAPTRPALRLRAEDAEDLAVISACLQDALVSVRDIVYDPDARSLVFVANRFCWEGCGENAVFERTFCGVTFDEIDNVRYRGFRRHEEDRILALLAIRPADGAAAHGGTIDLEFSGGATIRLHAAAIRCRTRDFGQPWATARQPDHPEDGK